MDKFAQFHIDSTETTMDDAKRLCLSEYTEHKIQRGCVSTNIQTKGQGRLSGRKWISSYKKNLLVTFWFPYSDFEHIPPAFAAALCVYNAITERLAQEKQTDLIKKFISNLRLKWPNDILYIEGNGTNITHEKKLCGILCTIKDNFVFIGIGLNCLEDEFNNSKTLYKRQPTSIFAETNVKIDPSSLIFFIKNQFFNIIEESKDPNLFGLWQSKYENLLAYKGSSVEFFPGIEEKSITAILQGINKDGSIVLQSSSGIVSFISGELSKK